MREVHWWLSFSAFEDHREESALVRRSLRHSMFIIFKARKQNRKLAGGAPFRLGLVTETAVRGYLDSLKQAGRAPRTRSKALSGLRRFCPVGG